MQLPTFQGNSEALIHQWVQYIDQAVERQRWSNEDYQTKMGRRSALDILREGNTGYMGACYDLTLATAVLALETTADPVLVIEEVENRRYGYLLHFALEIDERFVEYASCNTVFTGAGEYPGIWKKEDTSLAIRRLPLHCHDKEKLPDLLLPPEHYPHYNLPHRIEQVLHDNTEETYQLYRKAIAKEPHLTLKTHPRILARIST